MTLSRRIKATRRCHCLPYSIFTVLALLSSDIKTDVLALTFVFHASEAHLYFRKKNPIQSNQSGLKQRQRRLYGTVDWLTINAEISWQNNSRSAWYDEAIISKTYQRKNLFQPSVASLSRIHLYANLSLPIQAKYSSLGYGTTVKRISTTSLQMASNSNDSEYSRGNNDDEKSKNEKGRERHQSKANKNNTTYFDDQSLAKESNVTKYDGPSDQASRSVNISLSNDKRPRKGNFKMSSKHNNNQNHRGRQNNEQNKEKVIENDGDFAAKSSTESVDSSSIRKTSSRHCADRQSYLPPNDGSSIKTIDGNNSLKEFSNRPQQQLMQQHVNNSTCDLKANEIKEDGLNKRIIQLETLISNQMTEIQKLRREIDELTNSIVVFANVVEVLREAGLRLDEEDKESNADEKEPKIETNDIDHPKKSSPLHKEGLHSNHHTTFVEEEREIFGAAPATVTDAADAAGASILSAILAGKHRMLVDVRDAELTRDRALFVEFLELAILPVAAGLEGLDRDEYTRNRVKIVFPTVKDLMSYRRSMALAAPEVVALSTLGFDPVEERDNLIFIVAPSPDDIAGVTMMQKLLSRTDRNSVEPELRISQPVVVMNHHMVPIDIGNFSKFTVVYHLRLLSVQYMTGDKMPEFIAKGASIDEKDDHPDMSDEDDSALEAAMLHAHQIGVHQGVTRAMVIRAYPKPWHVFVDTSPDTDADFEVAATFDAEPTQEDINFSIVECLEGSEREDELVAQQMQAALEAGQLTRVSDMLGVSPTCIVNSLSASNSVSTKGHEGTLETDSSIKRKEVNDWDDLYYDDWFNEESI